MPAFAKGKQETGTHQARGKRTKNMVRVSDHTHSTLRELSEQTGMPMQELIAEAVETMRRRRILEMTNAAYAVMRADPERWQDELAERSEWDVALADGLEEE